MIDGRTKQRLLDILDAKAQIDLLLTGKTYLDLQTDRPRKAAFERFLEIISEASRHIPIHLQNQAPHIPWKRIADIGIHLRHAYNRVDAEVLWNIYKNGDLEIASAAVQSLLESAISED